MMPQDSLITLPWLCFWAEPIMSQHPQTCRLPLSAQTEQHSCWMQSTLSLLQLHSLLHARPLMLHFPCSDHTSGPSSLPTELLALPWPKKCRAFLFPQLWWNWKRHACSFQGPTNIFAGTVVRQRVVPFPDHFKWSCSKVPTRYAMQLPANAAGVPATARFREASSHLHVYALLLSLQKCGIYRYRPSGRTQACWDIGQSQLSFLFDLIWNLLVKECSKKFYHILSCVSLQTF